MEEKLLELFDTINESTINREHRMIKLQLLIHILLSNLDKLISVAKIQDKEILEKYKNTLAYIYQNFNTLYELNKKYENGFNEEGNISTYIDKFQMDQVDVKILNYLTNLIGNKFFNYNDLVIDNCVGVKNAAMLKLNKFTNN